MVLQRAIVAAAALALVPATQAWNIELPPCLEPFKPFVYSGCYQDSGNPPALVFRSSLPSTGMTTEKCMAECKGNGFRYAGLKYYGVCYCGGTVNGPQTDESQCNLPCDGDKSETCGGNNALSVYQDPTFPKTPNQTEIADYKSQGCYTDDSKDGRTLSYPIDIPADQFTTETCLTACKDAGFPIAGTEYGKECWCGAVLANYTAPVDASQCNMPCTGNNKEICGGPSRLSLYVAKDLESLEPCGSSPGTSTTSTTTSEKPTSTSTWGQPTSSSSSEKPTSTSTWGQPTSSSSSEKPTSTSTWSQPGTSSSTCVYGQPCYSSSTSSSQKPTSSSTCAYGQPCYSSSTSSSEKPTSTSSWGQPTTSSTRHHSHTTYTGPGGSSSTSSSQKPTSSSTCVYGQPCYSSSTSSSQKPTSSSTCVYGQPCYSSSTSSSQKPTSTSSWGQPGSSSTTRHHSHTTYNGPGTTSSKPNTWTTTSKPTASTTVAVCTTTSVIPPPCEQKCGEWCAPPLPGWGDKNGCVAAWKVCELQVSSCFKTAGWPDNLKCYEIAKWCKAIKGYCDGCDGYGDCNKDDCWNHYPPGHGGKPTTTTIIGPCSTSQNSYPTSTSSSCPPQPTNICKQPSSPDCDFGPGNPVGGVPLPIISCNDVNHGDGGKYPLKMYNSPNWGGCPTYPGNQGSNACADACKEQYISCKAIYPTTCKNLQANPKFYPSKRGSWSWSSGSSSSNGNYGNGGYPNNGNNGYGDNGSWCSASSSSSSCSGSSCSSSSSSSSGSWGWSSSSSSSSSSSASSSAWCGGSGHNGQPICKGKGGYVSAGASASAWAVGSGAWASADAWAGWGYKGDQYDNASYRCDVQYQACLAINQRVDTSKCNSWGCGGYGYGNY